MRVSHWTDFTPASSQIDNFYGGVKGTPAVSFDEFNSRGRMFASVAYRLAVADAHNGWHHYLAMYTSLQGVAYENGCIKQDCRTGYHHVCINFSIPAPAYTHTQTQANTGGDQYALTGNQWREASYRSTFMYAGEITNIDKGVSTATTADANYGSNTVWGANTIGMDGINSHGRIQDLFVLRPSLVNPTDPDTRYDLWNSAAYSSNTTGGQQMFFTGIPIAHPRFALNSFTTSPHGDSSGGSTTTWSDQPLDFAMPAPRNITVTQNTSITLAYGTGNTVIAFAQPGIGSLKVSTSLTGTSSSGHVVSPATIAHETGILYMQWQYVGGTITTSEYITVTITNNSVVDTLIIDCQSGI
tara:strand:+ start:124 stop:1191 length:1068 start_codon:yes stop_codon:yes gene_type:complete